MFDFHLSIFSSLDPGMEGIQEVGVGISALSKCIGKVSMEVWRAHCDQMVVSWAQEEGEAHGEDAGKG